MDNADKIEEMLRFEIGEILLCHQLVPLKNQMFVKLIVFLLCVCVCAKMKMSTQHPYDWVKNVRGANAWDTAGKKPV